MKKTDKYILGSDMLAAAFFILLLSLFILSCGGSSSGGSSFAGGGISGTGISSGAITGFGSVILNNSKYEVSSSTNITVNDTSGLSQGDLKLGMVAVVKYDGVNATSITADDELKGPVDSVDPSNSSLVVMGTQVVIDNNTVFDNISPADLTGLSAGDNVEVHGLFDFVKNIIRATRIEKIAQPGAGEFEVKGTIGNFDTTPGTFTIGGLTINYQTNNIQLPAGTGNGSFVEVKGTITGGILVATKVELEHELPDLDEDDEFEIEGIVTFVDDPQNPTQVIINGQTILIGNAEFKDGDASALKPGIRAEAEGSVNANGEFVAHKIKIKDSVKAETTVDSVDTANNTLTVFGSLTVRAATYTEFEDDRDNIQNFSISDIQPGDYLEIQGFPDGTDSIIALEIERDNDPGKCMLQGAVDSASNPNLTIMGVSVITDSSTEFEINDSQSDAATFFATVQVGDIIKVKEKPSSPPSGTLNAKSVSMESEDEDEDEDD